MIDAENLRPRTNPAWQSCILLVSCPRQMKKPFTLCLLAGLLFAVTTVFAAPAEPVWEVKALAEDGEFEFDPETKIVTATRGVQVNYGDSELTATRATLNQETGDIVAEGMVSLLREKHLWRGERLEYNFKTKVVKAGQFRTSMTPYFITGMTLRGDQTNQVHIATDVLITGDDVAEPGYKIRARSLTLVPGESFEARHATFYLGNVPVFYCRVMRGRSGGIRTVFRSPRAIVAPMALTCWGSTTGMRMTN